MDRSGEKRPLVCVEADIIWKATQFLRFLKAIWKQWRGKPLKERHEVSAAQPAGLLCRTQGHGFTSHTKTRWTRQRGLSWASSPVTRLGSSMEGRTVALPAGLCVHRWASQTASCCESLHCRARHPPFKTRTRAMTACPALEGRTQKQALRLI